MFFGFQFYNFRVRYAVKGKKQADVEACKQPNHGQFLVVADKDKLSDLISNATKDKSANLAQHGFGPNEIKMIFSFFTGKEMKPKSRYFSEWVPELRKVWDEDQFSDAKGFKIPPFADDEEPLDIATKKIRARADAIPDVPGFKRTAYKPEKPFNPDTSSDNSAAEDTEDKETQTMATKKAAKKSAKKSAKKAAPKSGEAKVGRRNAFGEGAKIKLIAKENPCHAEHAGKPSARHSDFEIIRKAGSGLLVADFVKKGGNLFNLRALIAQGHISVA